MLLLGFQTLIAQPTLEDELKAAENPDYFIHVVLTGIVKRMIFPGPPHYLSVEEGDWAEPRTSSMCGDFAKATGRHVP